VLFTHNPFTCDAVIFDLDGTLIDSTDVYIRILNVAFERLDLPPVSRESVLDVLIEGDFDWNRILPADLKERKEEIIEKSMAVIRVIYPQMFRHEVQLIPGAADILKALSKGGIKIGLVTSTQAKYLDPKLYPLKLSGIESLLQVIITTDDVPHKKPAADPLIECGKRLCVDMEKIVYVGDSRVDIRAGNAAGTMTIGVLTGVDEYEALKAENPDAILDSVFGLRDILPALKHSTLTLSEKP
jgi:HAD superfamily hydrolase (TIGR01549 family)